MSVLKSKRNESAVQFLETARDLVIYTIQQCAKFPKRFMFLITKDIVEISKEIYNNVKSANSIYPADKNEFQMRKHFVISANCALHCLVSQLDIAHEFIKTDGKDRAIKSKVWQTWMTKIDKEMKLLSALQKSDIARYKHLL